MLQLFSRLITKNEWKINNHLRFWPEKVFFGLMATSKSNHKYFNDNTENKKANQ